jgi:UDP-N-acetylmuramate dehydrogenase
MEFASGIPGTIGGAIVMNAGAYDGEMKMVVDEVRVLTQNGELLTLSNEELEFGYRTSRVKKEKLIVLSVTLLLQPQKQEDIYEKMNDFAARRREKQPLEYPSAGSTFKRPEGMFAGKLIMDAGLRGYSVGDAQVSEKHCGFVINKGNATAKEISTLIYDVQEKVKDSFGVTLEPEVIFIGDF